MAEDYAPLFRSIWNDDDFRALTGASQRLYLACLSSQSRNSAGLLSLSPRRWARAASDLTVHSVEKSLAELDDAGFLVVDYDTDEVLVRSYIRVAKVYRQIRILARALKEIEAVESERLRSAVGQELMRLPALVIPEREPFHGEAVAAQDRLNELASMLCDAPPEDGPHPMSQGVGQGVGHPIGTGTGTGTGTGVGPVLGSCSSSRSNSLEGNAGPRGLTSVVGGRWTA